MNPSDVSPGRLTEDEYLAIVYRIQQAMAIEPFRPSVIDVVRLLAEWRAQRTEIERLQSRLTEESAENDQWQKKVAELWTELERHASCTVPASEGPTGAA